MQYGIEVLGIEAVERVYEWVGIPTITYDIKTKQIGIITVEAEDECEALVKVVKLCSLYWDIYRTEYPSINKYIKISNYPLSRSKKKYNIEDIPDWLRYYFNERSPKLGHDTDFQSLTFRVLQ